MKINAKFPRYLAYDPLVPVWCVTPNEGRCIHRFFDTSPISPSMRYMAVLRMPQESRLPMPGEQAQIVLIDLWEGTEQTVAETQGWETQMGANINWGTSDNELYFNDVDTKTWEPHCVKLDPLSGKETRLEGTIYRISPDGRHIISANMKTMRRTQNGYGVVIPDELVPRNFGPRDDDGLYITDTATGKRRLLASIRRIFENAQTPVPKEVYEGLELYGFHCKFNPQGDRLLFTIRGYPAQEQAQWNMISDKMHFWVVTMRPDGSDIHVAVGPEQWFKHGHHINWQPCGEMLSMNLCIDGDEKLYLVEARYDGSGLRKIHETIPGSGHPAMHPNGRVFVTDAYKREPVAFGDGTVPLRFIDFRKGVEKNAVRINIANEAVKTISALRVDPHPAWAPDFRHVAFNGFVNGTRRVFIADFGELLQI